MNINLKTNNSKQTKLSGDKLVINRSIREIQKEAFKKIHDRARREMTQVGEFEKIVEKFTNPENSNIYIMEVCPSCAEGMTNKRYFVLGCEIPDTLNKLTCQIVDGTKPEILDYLGNDSNLDEVGAYYKMLEKNIENL